MVKISTIFILGLIVAVVQYSGFSKEFKDFLYLVFGLSITVLSYLIRKELHEVLKHLHDVTLIKAETSDNSKTE